MFAVFKNFVKQCKFEMSFMRATDLYKNGQPDVAFNEFNKLRKVAGRTRELNEVSKRRNFTMEYKIRGLIDETKFNSLVKRSEIGGQLGNTYMYEEAEKVFTDSGIPSY